MSRINVMKEECYDNNYTTIRIYDNPVGEVASMSVNAMTFQIRISDDELFDLAKQVGDAVKQRVHRLNSKSTVLLSDLKMGGK